MQTLAWPILSLVLIVFDATTRYFRFKNRPQMWTTRLIATGAVVWGGAWLIILYYFDRRLSLPEIVQSVVFGVLYFVILRLVGKHVERVAQNAPQTPRGSAARK